jgi:hypothetical protein
MTDGIVPGMESKADLTLVALALGLPRGLARLLDGGQQHAHQDSYHGDDNQQFYQR